MGLDKTAAGERRDQYIKFTNGLLPEQCEEFTFCIGRRCREASIYFPRYTVV